MIELPPLKKPVAFRDDHGSLFHEKAYSAESVEARERILLARIAEAENQRGQWAGLCVRLEARIAELEADAERYRWLRDNAAYSLSLTKDDHKICYETAAERIERDAINPECNPYDETPPEELERMAALDSIWSVYVYPITPIGHNCYHGATLDAAIDAARKA